MHIPNWFKCKLFLLWPVIIFFSFHFSFVLQMLPTTFETGWVHGYWPHVTPPPWPWPPVLVPRSTLILHGMQNWNSMQITKLHSFPFPGHYSDVCWTTVCRPIIAIASPSTDLWGWFAFLQNHAFNLRRSHLPNFASLTLRNSNNQDSLLHTLLWSSYNLVCSSCISCISIVFISVFMSVM